MSDDTTRFLEPSEVPEDLEQKIAKAVETVASERKLELEPAPNQVPVWYIGSLQISLVHHQGETRIAMYRSDLDVAVLVPSSASVEDIQESIEEGLGGSTTA